MENKTENILKELENLIVKSGNEFFAAEWRERIETGLKEDRFYYDLIDYLYYNSSSEETTLNASIKILTSSCFDDELENILKNSLYGYFLAKLYACAIDSKTATSEERKSLTKKVLKYYNLNYFEKDGRYVFYKS